jgi:hypothetical protein
MPLGVTGTPGGMPPGMGQPPPASPPPGTPAMMPGMPLLGAPESTGRAPPPGAAGFFNKALAQGSLKTPAREEPTAWSPHLRGEASSKPNMFKGGAPPLPEEVRPN